MSILGTHPSPSLEHGLAQNGTKIFYEHFVVNKTVTMYFSSYLHICILITTILTAYVHKPANFDDNLNMLYPKNMHTKQILYRILVLIKLIGNVESLCTNRCETICPIDLGQKSMFLSLQKIIPQRS